MIPPAADGRPDAARRAEDAAAALLSDKGYRIVARNWRVPEAELDLVALDGGTCVFVEVRSRTGDVFGHPLEAVTPRKRAQVVRAARHYLELERPAAVAYRFDVVGVLFAEAGGTPQCFHVANAFDASGEAL